MIRVCCVCLGNICRSPTAEAVLAHLVRQSGLEDEIEIEGAGTSGWHIGEPPDRRSAAAARRHGIELRGRSQQFVASEFERFEHVLAMDNANLRDLMALAPGDDARAKLSLFRDFSDAGSRMDVPDPYYGAGDGFERVFQICLASGRGFLAHLERTHELSSR